MYLITVKSVGNKVSHLVNEDEMHQVVLSITSRLYDREIFVLEGRRTNESVILECSFGYVVVVNKL